MEPKVDRKVAMRYPKFALISVADKTGIENLSRALCDFGFEILSTGDTGEALLSAGIPITEISEYTEFPTILDGRVQSLHPRVCGGIMAKDCQRHFEELIEIKASLVDIVICNLHSLKHLSRTPGAPLDELVDQIDIDGPTLLKAAAKNFERVATVCDTDKYEELLWYLASKGEVPYEVRFEWAKRAFEHVTTYDSMVFATLMEYDLKTGQRMIGDTCEY